MDHCLLPLAIPYEEAGVRGMKSEGEELGGQYTSGIVGFGKSNRLPYPTVPGRGGFDICIMCHILFDWQVK